MKMKTKYVYKNVSLNNDISGKTTDVVVRFHLKGLENAVSDKIKYLYTSGFTVTPYDGDSSIEMFQDATFVLHVFTQKCEELTSPRTPIPLEVSRLN